MTLVLHLRNPYDLILHRRCLFIAHTKFSWDCPFKGNSESMLPINGQRGFHRCFLSPLRLLSNIYSAYVRLRGIAYPTNKSKMTFCLLSRDCLTKFDRGVQIFKPVDSCCFIRTSWWMFFFNISSIRSRSCIFKYEKKFSSISI